MNTLSKIEALEQELTTLISHRKATAYALKEEVATGDATLAAFSIAPDPKAIGKAKAATATIAGATALLATLGNESAWIADAQSRWAGQHFSELSTELAALLAVRILPRTDYRKRQAERIGTLNVRLIECEGDAGTDDEMTSISTAIGKIEEDLFRRDNLRDVAQRNFQSFAQSTPDGSRGPFDSRPPRFELWTTAIAAVREVNYEQPEAHEKKD